MAAPADFGVFRIEAEVVAEPGVGKGSDSHPVQRETAGMAMTAKRESVFTRKL
jgi:hypothetical protein